MRKIILFSIFLIFVCNLIAFAGPFSDVPQGHWAFDAINSLTSKGIIKGYEDGTFGGNKVVSRYHLAVVISRMLASIEVKPDAISRADLKVVERLTMEFADELSLMNISVKSLEKELYGIKKDVSNLKTDVKNLKDFIKNVNKKYKLIWFVTDASKFTNIHTPNVKFVTAKSSKSWDKLKELYYNYSAKLILDGNNYVHKKHVNQTRIHLLHGISYKKVDKYLHDCGPADFFVVPGTHFNDYLSKNYRADKNCFKNFGFARNDVLLNNMDIKRKLGLKSSSKLILWLPTYRKHKDVKELNINDEIIPIYDSLNKLKKLNKELVKRDIYIYLKPHPAQDLSKLLKEELSNFRVILDSDLNKMNISLYEFLSGTDSLITDYSSVYFDYLLTQRIIGVTLDDIKEYQHQDKLFCSSYESIIGGEHIYNEIDFINYLDLLAKGKYEEKKYSQELKKYHDYFDNKSTKRLYDFIFKNILR